MEMPKIPSVIPNIPNIDGDWSWMTTWDGVLRTPGIPSFIDFNLPVPTIPSMIEFNQTLCISKDHIPDKITVEVPNIPTISISWDEPKIPNIPWGEPPQIKCVCVIRSPGDTYEQYLKARENCGLYITTEEKCRAIMERIAKEEGIEAFETFVDNLYKGSDLWNGQHK